MSESEEHKELGGLARSIDALFSKPDESEEEERADAEATTAGPEGAEGAEGAEDGVAVEPVDEEVGEAPVPEADLETAVGSELAGTPSEGIEEQDSEASEATDEAPVAYDEGGVAADQDVVAADEGTGPVDGTAEEEEAPPGPLAIAVEAFLSTPVGERVSETREVLGLAEGHTESNELDPVADAVERLVGSVRDSADEEALDLAREILTTSTASRLVARLGAERDEERRAGYVDLCERLGREMVSALSDALADTQERLARRTYLDTMIALGEGVRDVVEPMVEDGRWYVVRNGIAILSELGGERAVELVTSGLAHTDPRVRREALLGLARLGGEETGQLVPGMLSDPEAEVRRAAAVAAGELKIERAVKPLLALLEEGGDPDDEIVLLRALGQIGDPGTVSVIEKYAVGSFFSKPRSDLRIAAYRALHHIGTPKARRLLNQAVDDKNQEVKAAVRGLLGM